MVRDVPFPNRDGKKFINLLGEAEAVSARDMSPQGESWLASGPQPVLTFRLPRAMVRGGYVLELVVDGLDKGQAPAITMDDCSHLASPMRNWGQSAYKLFVYTLWRHRSVSIVFPQFNRPIRVRNFSVQRILRRTVFARAFRNGAKVGEESPTLGNILRTFRSLIARGFVSEAAASGAFREKASRTYAEWAGEQERNAASSNERLAAEFRAMNDPPTIGLYLPLPQRDLAACKQLIHDVRAQSYGAWRLHLLLDHAPESPELAELLSQLAEDERVCIHKPSDSETPSRLIANTEAGRDLRRWIMILSAGMRLPPHALVEAAAAAHIAPDSLVVYGDEDQLQASGERCNPVFKPDWNPEMFASADYIGNAVILRADVVSKHNSLLDWTARGRYELLRGMLVDTDSVVHVPSVLAHWAPSLTRGSPCSGNGSRKSGEIGTNGVPALSHDEHTQGRAANDVRVTYNVPDPPPLVSLIIPTRDNADVLARCLDSIRRLTEYRNFEIIVVDNASGQADALSYLAELEAKGVARVLRFPGEFNYSAINNFGVANAGGQLVGMLNDDVEVISPQWLTEMVALASRPGTGCVGAKLYYYNDTIQHAGVVVGLSGVAGHTHRYFPRDSGGYCGRLLVRQNVTAVTSACMVMRRSLFLEAGGMDDVNLKVAYNDVDLCLKVRQMGYLNVWTPYAELYHHESFTRGTDFATRASVRRYLREVAFMKSRWRTESFQDPYYSPHLTRDREDFSLKV